MIELLDDDNNDKIKMVFARKHLALVNQTTNSIKTIMKYNEIDAVSVLLKRAAQPSQATQISENSIDNEFIIHAKHQRHIRAKSVNDHHVQNIQVLR